jgi:LytS/YehU family sensor histidine kinase
MALQNISHRLKALYGPAAEINVRQGETSFSVAIAYPVSAMSMAS